MLKIEEMESKKLKKFRVLSTIRAGRPRAEERMFT